MSLADFKKNIKFAAVAIFMLVYAAGFYFFGKNSGTIDLGKVKGVSEEKPVRSPIETPVPFADTQTVSISSSYVKLCANTIYSYEVVYPKDWFSTYSTDDQKCSYFAPYSFVIPHDTSNFTTTIRVVVTNKDEWLGVTKFYENPNDFQNVISVKNIEVNGKSVRKVEAETTGSTEGEKGLVKVTYLILDSEKPVVISYQQAGRDEDPAPNIKILEDMVGSFRYF
ncbi:MAG: hypothetical protein Q8P25_02840 [Candidatus Curtissbacteria bacterium]|nr:hypothetical protein [Candidatus Curtissbacteria bacterium]